jgi:hypothetical protein
VFIKAITGGDCAYENMCMMRGIFEATRSIHFRQLNKAQPPVKDCISAVEGLKQALAQALVITDMVRNKWVQNDKTVLSNLENSRPLLKSPPEVATTVMVAEETSRQGKRKDRDSNNKAGKKARGEKDDDTEERANAPQKPCVANMAKISGLFPTADGCQFSKCRFSHAPFDTFSKVAALEALATAPGKLTAPDVELMKVHIESNCI